MARAVRRKHLSVVVSQVGPEEWWAAIDAACQQASRPLQDAEYQLLFEARRRGMSSEQALEFARENRL